MLLFKHGMVSDWSLRKIPQIGQLFGRNARRLAAQAIGYSFAPLESAVPSGFTVLSCFVVAGPSWPATQSTIIA